MQAAVEDCCAAHVEAVAGGVGAFSECGKREARGDGRDHLGMRCSGKDARQRWLSYGRYLIHVPSSFDVGMRLQLPPAALRKCRGGVTEIV